MVNYPEDIQLQKIKAYANYLRRDFDSSIVGFNKLLEMGDTSYFNFKYRGLVYFEKKEFEEAIIDLKLAFELKDKDAETCFFLGSALGRTGKNKEGISFLNRCIRILSPPPNELCNIYSEMAYVYLNQKKYELSLQHLKLAYRNKAKPILSFKMEQLYDYYLDNKKLAIDCYEGYLIMSNEDDTVFHNSHVIKNATTGDPKIIKNSKERIQKLNEEIFFESGKKE